MTVQSVGSFTAGLGTVTNQAGKSAATDSFSTVMTSKVNESKTSEATARKQSDPKNSISKTNRSSADEKQSVKDATSQTTTKEKTDKVLGNDSEEKVSATDMEDVLATLATLLNQITDLLEQSLNVTEEELTNQALSLEMEPADLLTGEGLKGLFLGLNDAQPEELLSDEELLAQFEELQRQLEALLEEAGITDGKLFEKLNSLANGENLLEDKAFGEVLNEYLTSETEEPQIEIRDLRTEVTAKVVETENAETNTEIRPVEETDENLAATEDDAKNPFIQSNDFIKNLAKAAEEAQVDEAAQPNTFRDLYNITGQTIEHIKVTLNADSSNMELQLNPEHLGKVNVQITSENGAVKAEITAHTEAAKRALEAGLEDLKVALEQTGLKVENVEVALADFGFRNRNENETGDNHGNSGRQRRRGMSGIETDPTLAGDMEETREIMKEINGNSVDYVV